MGNQKEVWTVVGMIVWVVCFTSTYAINPYHLLRCKFDLPPLARCIRFNVVSQWLRW